MPTREWSPDLEPTCRCGEWHWHCVCPDPDPDTVSVWGRLPGRLQCQRCHRPIWDETR